MTNDILLCPCAYNHVCVRDLVFGVAQLNMTQGDLEGCGSDNWGMPAQSRRPFTDRYEQEIRSKCSAQLDAGLSMAETFQDAMVNW